MQQQRTRQSRSLSAALLLGWLLPKGASHDNGPYHLDYGANGTKAGRHNNLCYLGDKDKWVYTTAKSYPTYHQLGLFESGYDLLASLPQRGPRPFPRSEFWAAGMGHRATRADPNGPAHSFPIWALPYRTILEAAFSPILTPVSYSLKIGACPCNARISLLGIWSYNRITIINYQASPLLRSRPQGQH